MARGRTVPMATMVLAALALGSAGPQAQPTASPPAKLAGQPPPQAAGQPPPQAAGQPPPQRTEPAPAQLALSSPRQPAGSDPARPAGAASARAIGSAPAPAFRSPLVQASGSSRAHAAGSLAPLPPAAEPPALGAELGAAPATDLAASPAADPAVGPGAPAGALPAWRTPAPAPAGLVDPTTEGRVSMAADSIAFDQARGTITAAGNVEVQFGDRVLRAARIEYDEARETLFATGPLSLVDPEAGVIFAESASITLDFSEGMIAGARLLVAGVMQLAAAELRRAEGRYTILHHSIASSCEVCPGSGVPTWAIRAERIIRDEEARLIHFRNARLELFGLPVVWLPYMRIPEPGVDRASGLLAPVLRRSSLYGLALKVPYYHVLGPHADLTLTPFLTERGGTLIEGEYRRRFAHGALDLAGAATLRDGLEDGGLRGRIAATGFYELGDGFRFELDLDAVTDDRFLRQFDYSDADRLTSTARIARTRARDRFELGLVGFQSLRPEEPRAQIPLILPEFRYRQLFPDAIAGGRIGVEADAVGILRQGGRDVLRLGGGGDWRRDFTLGPGLLVAASGGTDVDVWQVREDPELGEATLGRAVPWARAELRWPLVRTTATSVHLVEPVADIAWSTALGSDTVPNEDSLLPEFDETNLFALDRFPGRDRVETGLRAGLGLSYTFFDNAGSNAAATFGRVIRFSDEDQFAEGTGLAGRASDWVGAFEVGLGPGFSAINRIRLDDGLDVARNEFAIAYESLRTGLSASWYYLAADVDHETGPQPETSEVQIAARYRFRPNWQIRGNWRYDAARDTTLRAGGGITYGNECAEFDLSVSRRFVSAGEVSPATSLGFSVRLVGLGGGTAQPWPRRTCNG